MAAAAILKNRKIAISRQRFNRFLPYQSEIIINIEISIVITVIMKYQVIRKFYTNVKLQLVVNLKVY